MYARILVPMDGSPTSERALEEALKLARPGPAQLRVVFAIEVPHTFGHAFVDVGAFRDGMRAMGRQVLARATEKARAAGVEVAGEILEGGDGPVAAAIVQDAARFGADVIVMGTHGRHGIDRVLLGSVAQGVIRDAKVPVLVVRS